MPQAQRKLICTNPNCNQTGHTVENCYWKGGGKEAQPQANSTTLQHQPNNPTQANLAANIGNVNPSPAVTYALMADLPFSLAAIFNDQMELLESYLSEVIISPNAFTVQQSKGEVLTYADSGATDHCFVQQSDFEDYQTYTTPHQGMSANRRGVFGILGTGMVQKMVKGDGKI
ncbi:hypothetical protein C0989_004679, partial [Termitomyces sp. Mn162]